MLFLVIHHQRRMVGETLLLVDARRYCLCSHTRCGNLVVDAPTDVLGPGLAAIRPPGVGFQFGMQFAEHIDEADFVEQLGEPGALFRQEAGILFVAAPVLQVFFGVGDVPVAADDDVAPALPQLARGAA